MKLAVNHFILFITLSLLSVNSFSQTVDPLADLFADEPEYLEVDEAFQFDFAQQNGQLTLKWTIVDGYYLYKKQFKTVLKNAELGEPIYPESEQIEDEFFGLSDIFRGQLAIQYPIISSVQNGVVKIRYQGCADAGLCYPPTIKEVFLTEMSSASLDQEETGSSKSRQIPVSEQFELASLLSSEQSLLWTLVLFLGTTWISFK